MAVCFVGTVRRGLTRVYSKYFHKQLACNLRYLPLSILAVKASMSSPSAPKSNGHNNDVGLSPQTDIERQPTSNELHGLKNSDRLVWVDLEMTGLDSINDRILEIACLVTEGDLQIVAEGPNIIIYESDQVLNNMGEWCQEQHGKSGLTEAVRRSKISLKEAEQMVLDFVRQHTPKGKCPLAGNSIGVDKSFLERHMPELCEHLHYRVVDVSTVKELCRRWFPEDFRMVPVKTESHRALDDILESIKELKYYRAAIFK